MATVLYICTVHAWYSELKMGIMVYNIAVGELSHAWYTMGETNLLFG